jgi:hypothetical protein
MASRKSNPRTTYNRELIMQNDLHVELDDTLNTELEQCINELKRIVSSSTDLASANTPSTSTETMTAPSTLITAAPQRNFMAEIMSLAIPEQTHHLYSRLTSNLARKHKSIIGERARLRGEKTPSPKRPAYLSDDSPLRMAFWQSPDKPSHPNGRKRSKTSLLSQFEIPEELIPAPEGSPYSSGQKSPSPNLDKSSRASPRHLSGPGSQSFSSDNASPNAAVLGQAKPVDIRSSPKTAGVSSPSSPSNLDVTSSKVHNQLTAILKNYRKLTLSEAKELSKRLDHSKALLPKNILLNLDQQSISNWMSPELLNLLSLSTLEQMNFVVMLTRNDLANLLDQLNLIKIEHCDDNVLSTLFKQVQQSIKSAIEQDFIFGKMVESSLKSYQNDSQYFVKYFNRVANESSVIPQLCTYLGSESTCTPEYLEQHPTLVRHLVERSSQYLRSQPESDERLTWYRTLRNLEQLLIADVEKYQAALEIPQQSPVRCF